MKAAIYTLENLDELQQVLNYRISEINRDYLIKVYGMGINKLYGVCGLANLIGIDNVNKTLARAYACKGDKCVCKLRRGLQVTYYIH